MTVTDLIDVTAATLPTPRAVVREQLSLPCVYCRGPIPADAFAFWSAAKRLLSATCPDCDRRVTLATSTWRRWLATTATR